MTAIAIPTRTSEIAKPTRNVSVFFASPAGRKAWSDAFHPRWSPMGSHSVRLLRNASAERKPEDCDRDPLAA